jgi:hypothetical protein
VKRHSDMRAGAEHLLFVPVLFLWRQAEGAVATKLGGGGTIVAVQLPAFCLNL